MNDYGAYNRQVYFVIGALVALLAISVLWR
jgi:hypothetical protein